MSLYNRKKFEQWLPASYDGLFEWDFLKPCFSRGIMPMDIDACVEVNGHFLMFETKEHDDRIPNGQKYTLTRQWKQPKTSILHISGKTPHNINGYCLYKENERKTCSVGDRKMTEGNYIDVMYIVACWFRFCEKLKQPTREEWENEIWIKDNTQ